MIDPMAMTVAVEDPEIAPKNADATKVTIARPPGRPPTIAAARLTSLFETPPLSSRPPAIMKNGMAMNGKESVAVKKRCTTTISGRSVYISSGIAAATARARAIGTLMADKPKKIANRAAAIRSAPPHSGKCPCCC